MPQHDSTAPVCRDCKGFAAVAVTTGTRHRDGSRTTLLVDCRTCKGTGHTAPTAALSAGR
ncbi:RNase P subunit RPR2 [Streptomyces sp. V3I8]|uniref:hypothetical protein n=1 Tax=Streptomyces sp. V3I8 TaxID=3042279 RepID=UPI002786F4DF|nr:hypothetical protein [Streptomyces sp. V3I8]MDQ1037685.1 RNase P subunit RPR2 [Streptomyces sp. V3I8]